jgi:hypothetical protein
MTSVLAFILLLFKLIRERTLCLMSGGGGARRFNPTPRPLFKNAKLGMPQGNAVAVFEA